MFYSIFNVCLNKLHDLDNSCMKTLLSLDKLNIVVVAGGTD